MSIAGKRQKQQSEHVNNMRNLCVRFRFTAFRLVFKSTEGRILAQVTGERFWMIWGLLRNFAEQKIG
jgi:hypothetical protein